MDYPTLDLTATGERIKELRVKNNLRVKDISIFMGFENDQAVYKWQRGDSLPSVDNLYALSLLFGVTIDEILVGNKKESDCSSFLFYALHSFYYLLV